MLLILLSLAFIAGVFAGPVTHLPLAVGFTIPVLAIIAFFSRHRKRLALLVLCLIVFTFGIMRFDSNSLDTNQSQLHLDRDSGQVEVRAMVASDPEPGEKTLQLLLRVTEIKKETDWKQISGNLLAFVPEYSTYHYGDSLELRGELKTPPEFPDFNYREYLAQKGIHVTVLYPEIKVLETGKGFKPLSVIYALRREMAEVFGRVLPEPQASLADGIILGMRGNIPTSLKDDFARSGTTHLLAISGVNLSIIAGMLASFTSWLFGRRHGIHIFLTLSVLWFYSLLTGFAPPVVRSAVMASLFLLAELSGRQKSALPALAFSAAVMTAFSPQILWDASFKLSFLATFGVIQIYPAVRKLSQGVVSNVIHKDGILKVATLAMTDSLAMSFAALSMVTPLLIHYFGLVSLSSFPATALALPVLAPVIVGGILTGVSGLVFLPLARIIGYINYLLLSYLIFVVRLFSDVPFAFFEVKNLSGYFVPVYYLLLALALWLINRRQKASFDIETPATMSFGRFISGLSRKWVVLPVAVGILVVVPFAFSRPDGNLRVSFLDVGQGDAILIQEGNKQALVDGGPVSRTLLLELGRNMPFKDRTIELVVATHSDADHLTGLVEVMKRYEVPQVLCPDMDFSSKIGSEWRQFLNGSNVKNNIAARGQQIRLGETLIEVINPENARAKSDDDGIVLRISRGKVSFLLTADITTERELDLIFDRADLRSSVLKVAHHGSIGSTSREFVSVVHPEAAVISVGANNRFGHPKGEVLEKLKEYVSSENIYRTDKQGTIEFTTDGERLWVKRGK